MAWTQSVSVGIGKTLSTFVSKNTDGAVGVVIDLIAKGNGSRSKSTPSTSMLTTSLPLVRPVSAPLGTGKIGPAPIAQSPSKLAHILFSQSALESEEEEGSEGDELPTFHRGSAKSKRAPIVRAAPRPFPMQLAELPVSPFISRFRTRDENDDGGGVETVDVFTTPHGPSPPRSPTPSPSPVKPLPVQASAGPATFVKSEQPGGFPTSPTKPKFQTDAAPRNKKKQPRHVSSNRETHVSGGKGDGILKSPRKSVAHSSPRHVPRTRGRTSSPTPLTNSALRTTNVALWTGDGEGHDVSDSRQPQLEDSGSTRMGDGVGRKPRPSDASAIYISSGSEDEGNVGLGFDNDNREDIGEVEANGDQGEDTDPDEDGWADTGMILSAPPSPAPLPASDLVPTVPAVEVALPDPARVSKFKPAASKVDVRIPPAESQPSAKIISTSLKDPTNNGDTAAPRPAHLSRAPLLVARAKRRKGRDDDVIDLTSD